MAPTLSAVETPTDNAGTGDGGTHAVVKHDSPEKFVQLGTPVSATSTMKQCVVSCATPVNVTVKTGPPALS